MQARIIVDGSRAYLVRDKQIIVDGPLAWVRKIAICMGYSYVTD